MLPKERAAPSFPLAQRPRSLTRSFLSQRDLQATGRTPELTHRDGFINVHPKRIDLWNGLFSHRKSMDLADPELISGPSINRNSPGVGDGARNTCCVQYLHRGRMQQWILSQSDQPGGGIVDGKKKLGLVAAAAVWMTVTSAYRQRLSVLWPKRCHRVEPHLLFPSLLLN